MKRLLLIIATMCVFLACSDNSSLKDINDFISSGKCKDNKAVCSYVMSFAMYVGVLEGKEQNKTMTQGEKMGYDMVFMSVFNNICKDYKKLNDNDKALLRKYGFYDEKKLKYPLLNDNLENDVFLKFCK